MVSALHLTFEIRTRRTYFIYYDTKTCWLDEVSVSWIGFWNINNYYNNNILLFDMITIEA